MVMKDATPLTKSQMLSKLLSQINLTHQGFVRRIQTVYIPSINFNVNNRKFITKWHKGNKKQKHSKHNYLLEIRNGEINNKSDSYKANVED